MTAKQAIAKIKREIKKKGYRENMCYPAFHELQEKNKNLSLKDQWQIEANFWAEYHTL